MPNQKINQMRPCSSFYLLSEFFSNFWYAPFSSSIKQCAQCQNCNIYVCVTYLPDSITMTQLTHCSGSLAKMSRKKVFANSVILTKIKFPYLVLVATSKIAISKNSHFKVCNLFTSLVELSRFQFLYKIAFSH